MSSPLHNLTWPVRTEHLLIRPATAADAPSAWAYRRLEEVARWMTTLHADEEGFTASFTEPSRLAKTLMIERDGQVIGDLMLAPEDAWAQTEVAADAKEVQAELGWSMDPAHQGHGYATEAVTALIRICFEGLGLRRVVALCFAENAPSWRLMERVGMRRESHNVGDSLHRTGGWMDGYGYALLAEEWRAR
ncbi:GNAT family N-acetyltransferase [Occultella gossypii]|uniref:GNAT family N-acetyltransferase n=1 Tax=Occultella gossypii TaxID=2800820 RepID=A0ABS7SF88_9MICO|nr:GNAT family protein [Occultella gossypii]MBZ2198385.1 GNAT family N-acetyltransferase [Occultella gossypii]